MGLFSGLFGGGGGSSSSTTNKTEVNVEPVTNVTVETEDIANAIEKGAQLEAKVDLEKHNSEQNQEKALKMQELQQEHEQQSKKNYQMLLVIILGGLLYYKGNASS